MSDSCYVMCFPPYTVCIATAGTAFATGHTIYRTTIPSESFVSYETILKKDLARERELHRLYSLAKLQRNKLEMTRLEKQMKVLL